MIDHVIVTVRSTEKGFDIDMELPSKIAISDLATQLLENLKAIAPHYFIGKESIQLQCRNKILTGSQTLEKEYVYDGAIIEVI